MSGNDLYEKENMKENIAKALKTTKATFIDVSSGVEKSRGEKCKKKIESFIKYVKNYEKNK